MNKPTTTLARIFAHDPCAPGYKALCKGLGGVRKYGKDTPITVRQLVEINGLDGALWYLRTMPEHNRRWRLLAVRYARRVQHLMRDQRSLDALDIAERHANGQATDDELSAALYDALSAALSAARAAAWAAFSAAASTTAARAALHAASDAEEAVESAACDTARDAERAWQRDELIRISEEDL